MASSTALLAGSPRLVRLGGVAALLGGALAVALTPFPAYRIDGLASSPPGEYLRAFLTGLATLLFAGGLAGLHARQAGASGYGRLGAAGFVLAFVATVAVAVLWPAAWLAAEASAAEAFARSPSAETPAPGVGAAAAGLVGLAQSFGLVLLGVATVRARALPLPWAALPLALVLLEALSTYVAPPAFFALGGRNPESPVLDVLPLLGSLCWALLGYALLSGRGGRVGRPARVR